MATIQKDVFTSYQQWSCKAMKDKRKDITILPQKNKGDKKEIPKSFELGIYKFFPCSYPKSISLKFKYFLLVRGCLGFHKKEIDSPRFKSKEEAINFAETNKDLSVKPF